jgi:uncharacterized phage infection (PIP) family protein YhgE
MWGRDSISKAAGEIAETLMLVENIKALQDGQKQIASAIASLDARMRELEISLRTVEAETKLAAIKDSQQLVNAVQSAFYQKLTALSERVAQFEKRDIQSHDARPEQTGIDAVESHRTD